MSTDTAENPEAEALFALELAAASASTAALYGRYGLQFSPYADAPDFLAESQVLSRVCITCDSDGVGWPLKGRYDALPFENERCKLVVCHHIHEMVAEPQALLCALCELVAPDGLLIACSTGPYRRRHALSRMQRWTPTDLSTVLMSCGLDPVAEIPLLEGSAQRCYAWIRRHADWIPTAWLANFSKGYLMIAKKRSRLNGELLSDEKRRRLTKPPVAAPTAGFTP